MANEEKKVRNTERKFNNKKSFENKKMLLLKLLKVEDILDFLQQ